MAEASIAPGINIIKIYLILWFSLACSFIGFTLTFFYTIIRLNAWLAIIAIPLSLIFLVVLFIIFTAGKLIAHRVMNIKSPEFPKTILEKAIFYYLLPAVIFSGAAVPLFVELTIVERLCILAVTLVVRNLMEWLSDKIISALTVKVAKQSA